MGEAGKLVITAVLFALVFSQVRPINALGVFVGYALVQLINWLVPIMQN